MKEIVNHPVYGEIVYNESFWTGKKSLTVNGTVAQPVSKKEFTVNGEKALINGNLYTGIHMTINGEDVELSPKPKWYEIVLAIIPVLFLLTWGNSATLCAVFPVVGGAIGGAIGALFSLASLHFMKKAKGIAVKLLIGIGAIAAALLVSYLLAILLFLALY